MKKIFVVTVLFALPIVAYLFFASGINNFGRLPVLTENVGESRDFTVLEGGDFSLADKITILGFPGKNPLENITGAYHLTEKIYEPYHEFQDLQFVFVVPEGAEEEALEMRKQLGRLIDMGKWKFVVGTEEAVNRLFNGLGTNLSLQEDLSTPNVFIVDKNGHLRGRSEDEKYGVLYGYDARSVAVVNNEMKDDVKVILAEYRLELKKYNSTRSK